MRTVHPIRAFDDNYIWCLVDATGTLAAVVDPGDAEPVLEDLERAGRTLVAIIITHHHRDHVGGIARLLADYPGIPVYGPTAGVEIPHCTVALAEGDEVTLPADMGQLSVCEVPGHTAGHIAYLGDGQLFCGDTLFAGGCGRVFDGTFEQLAASLRRIRTLPAQTLVFCAHEYTMANLGFAQWVEPDSAALAGRIEADSASRARDEPTVPSLLQLELETNPFLRSDVASVKAAAERWSGHTLVTETDVFTALRQWKDRDYD